MRILAIETSCDETALSLMDALGGLRSPRFKIIRQTVSSQVKLHAPFGGVVPMLAKREHAKNLPLLLKKLSPNTDYLILNTDLIAVTVGPGLEPALWEGINFAKNLATKCKKPVLGVNHLDGHIYSNWIKPLNKKQTIKFPAVCLIASGGHTILTLMTSLTKWKILGATRDDAVGECFDKVARMLKLPYPGGPEIEKHASRGNEDAIAFPSPMLDQKNFDFSYSGLKTSVLYYLRDHKKVNKNEVAASFQKAAFLSLIKKSIRAAAVYRAQSVLLCGGVASSRYLRRRLATAARRAGLSFHAPGMKLNTDNASMIAAAAYINWLQKKKPLSLRADGNLNI